MFLFEICFVIIETRLERKRMKKEKEKRRTHESPCRFMLVAMKMIQIKANSDITFYIYARFAVTRRRFHADFTNHKKTRGFSHRVLDPLVEIMFHATKKNYTKTLKKLEHELRIF